MNKCRIKIEGAVMTTKYFIIQCVRKSSKHPEKNHRTFAFAIQAHTKENAKHIAIQIIKKQDHHFMDSKSQYSEWYRQPQAQRITREEFNDICLEQNVIH